MKKITLFCLFLAGLLMAGSVSAEGVHTAMWYRKNAAARAEVLRTCRNNPGELGNTPECLNAEKADFGAMMARKNGIFIQEMDLGPTPWRNDNPDNPLPYTRKWRENHE